MLTLLHDMEFVYILEMDGNRADDGISLRDRFAYENDLDWHEVDEMLDGPCSILEMMVALSKKCADYMAEADEPDNTSKWFFMMIQNLGLIGFDDDAFDEGAAVDILNQFMRREYMPDGRGGLFTVAGRHDMRTVEIWYQMMYWLDDYIYK